MEIVKTKQRYKCDFCSRRSTKKTMETHEKICWNNPNRHCELCKDKNCVDLVEMNKVIQCIPCSKISSKEEKQN